MRKAFTLIELMVVIAIIAILASIGIYQIVVAWKEIPKKNTGFLTQMLSTDLNQSDSLPLSTHIGKAGDIDPEKNLHPVNCDSLIRFLYPNQAKLLGYKDTKMLGVNDNNNSTITKHLAQRFGNKWVVVDAWNRPLIYINQVTTFRLYSVGPNGKDEGGRGDDIPQDK